MENREQEGDTAGSNGIYMKALELQKKRVKDYERVHFRKLSNGMGQRVRVAAEAAAKSNFLAPNSRTPKKPPRLTFDRSNSTLHLRQMERLWMFPSYSRQDATKALFDLPTGSFIVRNSSSSPSARYVLTVRLDVNDPPVSHFPILVNQQGFLIIQGSNLPFLSIYDLLAFYCFKQSGGMPCLLKPPDPTRKEMTLESSDSSSDDDDDTYDDVITSRSHFPPTSKHATLPAFPVSPTHRLSSSSPSSPPISPPPLPPRTLSMCEPNVTVVTDPEEGRRLVSAGVGPVVDRYPAYEPLSVDPDNLLKLFLDRCRKDSCPDREEDEGLEGMGVSEPREGEEAAVTSKATKEEEMAKVAVTVTAAPAATKEKPRPRPLPRKKRTPPPKPPRTDILVREEVRRAVRRVSGLVEVDDQSKRMFDEMTSPHSSLQRTPSSPSIGARKPRLPLKPGLLSSKPASPTPTNSVSRLLTMFEDDKLLLHRTRSVGPPLPPKPRVVPPSVPAKPKPVTPGGVGGSKPAVPPRTPAPVIPPKPPRSILLRQQGMSREGGGGGDLKHAQPSSLAPNSGRDNRENRPSESELDETTENVEDTRSSEANKERKSGGIKWKPSWTKKLQWTRKPRKKIRSFILELAENHEEDFGRNIHTFVTEMRQVGLTVPHQKLLSDVRKFVTEMHDFLLENHRAGLVSCGMDTCRNFEHVMETSLQACIIGPLAEIIYQRLEEYFASNGSSFELQRSINISKTLSPQKLGVRSNLIVPNEKVVGEIALVFARMLKTFCAIRKLEYLLEAVRLTYENVRDSKQPKKIMTDLGADDFLPLFVWVLVQCQFYRAEIEAEYMWGVAHPSLFNGEGGYYLTTLTSAVNVLKEAGQLAKPQSAITTEELPSMNNLQTELKIFFEDQNTGQFCSAYHLPIMPTMTAAEICEIVAEVYRIPNPQDYALFTVINGQATMVMDHEKPQQIKLKWMLEGTALSAINKAKSFKFFAYKLRR